MSCAVLGMFAVCAVLLLTVATTACFGLGASDAPKLFSDKYGNLHVSTFGDQRVFVNDIDLSQLSHVLEETRRCTLDGSAFDRNASTTSTDDGVQRTARVWSAKQLNVTTASSRINDISYDPTTNSIVAAGHTEGFVFRESQGGKDMLVFKMSLDTPEAEMLWAQQIGWAHDDEARGVVFDPRYNGVYVVGVSDSQTFTGHTDDSSYPGMAFIVDGETGTVLGTNQRLQFTTINAVTVAHDLNDQKKAPRRTRFGSPSAADLLAVARPIGNSDDILFAAGWSATTYFGELYGMTDVLIAKGTRDNPNDPPYTWGVHVGTPGFDRAEAVAVNGSSTDVVYVAGYTRGAFPNNDNQGRDDAFVLAFDASNVDSTPITGNDRLLWCTQFGTEHIDRAHAMVYDAQSELLYVAGFTDGSLHGNMREGTRDLFVTAVSPVDGGIVWTLQDGVAGMKAHALSLEVLDGGETLAVGGYVSTQGASGLAREQGFVVTYKITTD
ncbi:hypothetical protein PTSG_09033 [Salpingoeca rosetta]|uniref:Uncharacterized protein n=1 Tax=Salpingoeca rosetta (strain ATCC 50818 / BSB-021) TaxID=946362 RepID=F2UM07_SALR5|nr:uncharacterized protein PTSG_09033 [Salpingoeca rosetta]EGD78156.1 hypothetical protein PTSG_09033 [Salpingoeca rosetta]|eukprot:XP_004989832.1 hypothetical protein PTSG_09033 [Salpingoeca rosetta]